MIWSLTVFLVLSWIWLDLSLLVEALRRLLMVIHLLPILSTQVCLKGLSLVPLSFSFSSMIFLIVFSVNLISMLSTPLSTSPSIRLRICSTDRNGCCLRGRSSNRSWIGTEVVIYIYLFIYEYFYRIAMSKIRDIYTIYIFTNFCCSIGPVIIKNKNIK